MSQPAYLSNTSFIRVLITGASSGLGKALARHYLEQGATIAAIARRGEMLQELSSEYPGRVYCYVLDVRNSDALQNAATDFISKVGIPDIVIANAGVSIGTFTEYAEDEQDYQVLLDTNILGIVNTFRPFVALMRSAGRGTLVGIASVAGFRGLPGASAYSASKAAVISYLESLRVEMYGSGVKVVTICPGYIRTPMTAVNPYSMPFLLDPNDAAKKIAGAIERHKAFTVIPWQMGLVGFILKRMPRWLYDWLFSKAPHKPRRSTIKDH